MAVHLISSIDVDDEAGYEEFHERSEALVSNHGGRYLVIGGETSVLRGDWSPQRLTLIQFDDADSVEAMFDSDEFARLRELAAGTVQGNLVRVDDDEVPAKQRSRTPSGTRRGPSAR
ncbi:MAG: DUF1330 domain-containing protein [Acidimicrobiia bacterium]|nr:DUF1330 domain-containing protein [Acidimicrobiia bacterium]